MPYAANKTHASIALSSSECDCGENTVFTHAADAIDPDDPAKMNFWVAFEWTQAGPQSCCLNDAAPINMLSMFVTRATSHLEMSALNDAAAQNVPCIFVTLDTSHLEISPLNNSADPNMVCISSTLDTSHLEISLLNDFEFENMADMSFTFDTSHFETSPLKYVVEDNILVISVTLDTSHSQIGPCLSLEKLPNAGDIARHVSTALLSSDCDCGENRGPERDWAETTVVATHAVDTIDPGESSNMSSLVAFE